MKSLPSNMYWAVFIVLAILTLGYGATAIALALQHSPVPNEIGLPVVGFASATGAWLFGKKDDDNQTKGNNQP